MPKFKCRSTDRGQWKELEMKEAIKKVSEGKLSLRVASEKYNVPKSSLHDRVQALKTGKEIVLQPKLGRFTSTFSNEYSTQLYNHVKELDNRLMPLTRIEFLKLAFDLAENLNIPHRFNKEKKMAGKDFFVSFKNKHPDVVLRTPESTSIARAVGFNKPQVDRFFDHLEQLQEKHKFPAARIYNADETGVSNVHQNEKVISMKGKRQVGKLTSGERGKNVTVMCAMSPTGHFIPPLFIFPRKRMDKNGRLMIGAPAGSIAIPHESGWMNSEIFLQWLQHFKQHVHPDEKDPVLLILDGHASHKELSVIEFARKNNIHMLSTPPHTTHKLQPLDRSFFKPFKAGFSTASAVWMRNNPGARITDYDIAGLVDYAFTKAARLEIAQNGFRCSGIYPVNRDIFTDLDYLPSMMTEIQQESEVPITPSTRQELLPTVSLGTLPRTSPEPLPSTSRDLLPTTSQEPLASTSREASSSSRKSLSAAVAQLSPLPDASKKRLISRTRKSQKSEILTSSPYKADLEKKKAASKAKTMKTKRNIQSLGQDSGDKDTECIICGETFEEDWIQCHKCKDWAHEECVDLDTASLYYYCDVCIAKKQLGHN